jgi:acyl dehydratase
MMDLARLRAYDSGEILHRYTAKDSILYALGIGAGAASIDDHALTYLFEPGMQVLPTLASVLATAGNWMQDRPELGIRWQQALHGSERVIVHRPLRAAGALLGRTLVLGVADKGAEKGAVVALAKTLHDAHTGELLATCERQLFLRGNGGFSSAQQPGDAILGLSREPPTTAPSHVLELPTRHDQALIYRLMGDMNPLHADPGFAQRAGYPRPILHGLSTLGGACHALVSCYCGDEASRVSEIHARFSGPVFPGETIRVHCWQAGPTETLFEAMVPERQARVLRHGVMRWV